eukprot:scaffold16.g63.t1
MDRRKTLAGLSQLSPAQLNSRASLAPGRVLKGEPGGAARAGAPGAGAKLPLDKALARMSLAGPVQRRSSAYTTKAPGVKSDPRPIGDKLYQQNCVRTVIAYLASHAYEYQVLSSPTTRDFTNIMMFLLRQIDPNLLKAFGKLEEEVPQLYKRLKYPFQISKSNLTAVGSPHTWPSLLAALTWLVELLNYQERAEAARQDAGDERARAEAEFFEYVSTSYRYFMALEDALCEELDAAMGAEAEARAAGVRADTERLAAANEALRGEIEALRSQPSPLVAARAKHEETLADKEKFVRLLDNLGAHRAALQRKLAERQADVAAQAAELAAAERENEGLRSRIADVMRMNQEKTKQEGLLRSAQGQREALERRVADQEAAVGERLDCVEASLQGYHSRADRLQARALIPASAKRAEGVNFEVRLDRGAGSPGEMINVDLKGIIKPALQRLRDAYAARARELGEAMLGLQERRDAGRELLGERTEEIRAAEAQVRKLEGDYRAARAALEAEAAAAAARMDELAGEVAALRSANSAGVAESEERLRALQAEYEDAQRTTELDANGLQRDLAAALELVLNHKVTLSSKVKAAHGRMQRLAGELAALPPPIEAGGASG